MYLYRHKITISWKLKLVILLYFSENIAVEQIAWASLCSPPSQTDMRAYSRDVNETWLMTTTTKASIIIILGGHQLLVSKVITSSDQEDFPLAWENDRLRASQPDWLMLELLVGMVVGNYPLLDIL